MRTLIVLAALTLVPGTAFGQRAARRQAPAARDGAGPITPGEVQRMFDAWVLVQAQDALQLSEEQYGRFVTRLKTLQDTRRRHQQVRTQLLGDLRRTLNATAPPPEATLRETMNRLHDEDDRAAADIRKAADAVDDVLDARQQARFRLFEERMEARKLELLLKARQNVRQGRGK
jgi:hypothetical protein